MQEKPTRNVETSGTSWTFGDDGGIAGVALGYRVRFHVPGWIVQASWLQSADDSLPHAAYLIGPDFSLLKMACWLPETIAGGEAGFSWVHRNIKPAWRVEADTTYEFLVWRARQHYGLKANALDSAPLDNGDWQVVQNNFDGASSAGLFTYAQAFSTDLSRAEGTLYAVDFGF